MLSNWGCPVGQDTPKPSGLLQGFGVLGQPGLVQAVLVEVWDRSVIRVALSTLLSGHGSGGVQQQGSQGWQ